MFMLQRMSFLAVAGNTALPVSFVAAATGRDVGGVTINKPTGTTTGDIMIAIVGSGASVNSTTVTPPSGWTLLTSNASKSPFVYGKVDGGSEPSSYTWTLAAGNAAGAIATYRNGVAGVAGAVSEDSIAPSITPASTGTLLGLYFITNNVTVSSDPSGMTQRAFTGGANPTVAVYDQENVGASATGTKTITWSGAGNMRSVLQHVQQA
jgi:hypothetical protein